MGIKITLDTRAFETLLVGAAAQIPKAMRAVVSKVARDARRTALDVAARDGNEPLTRATKGIPTVVAARLGNLSASWRVPSVGVEATDTSAVGTSVRKGPIALAVEMLSGGGSSNVLLPRGFVIRGKSSGKPILYTRQSSGPWGTVEGAKHVFGEMTKTGMAQESGAARQAWTKQAEAQMRTRTAEAVAAALSGSRSTPSEGAD